MSEFKVSFVHVDHVYAANTRSEKAKESKPKDDDNKEEK